MKRVWRWSKRFVLGVVGFAVLALAITIGTLHTNWGRNRVRLIAQEQLQAVFPGSTIGRIEGSVLGDLVARDVTLMGPDQRPLVTIGTLTLRAALLPLAGKTARVDAIHADDVVVYARPLPDEEPAKEPEPETPSSPSEPSAWSVELPAIQVTRGRVVIETASGTEQVSDLRAGVSLSLRSGEPIIASVVATASWRAQPIAIHALVAQGDHLDVPFASVALGNARVNVVDARIDGAKISAGALLAHAPAALAKQLADLELPGDVAVAANLSPAGDLRLGGSLGAARLDVVARTDLETQSARAIVVADVPDVAAASFGAVTGAGTVVATVVAGAGQVNGMIAVGGEAHGTGGRALVGIDATLERARVLIAGKSDPPAQPPTRRGKEPTDALASAAWRLGGSLLVERSGDDWRLAESVLVANATTALGTGAARLEASGPLTPEPALTVRGTLDGRDVRYDDLSIAHVHTRIAATNIPARPTGSVSVELTGAKQGTLDIPLAKLGARGVLHETGVIEVDLDQHVVRMADGNTWSGRGGRIRVTDTSVAVTGVATGSGQSRLTAQALIGLTSDALSVKASARDISLAMLDPTLAGSLGADVELTRRGGTWKGTATVDAQQVALPKRPVIDGKLAIQIDKRRVTARATASNPAIGSATLDIDVLGPRDITDAHAWQRLERSAVQNIRIALAQIDASKLGASGNLDGEIAIFASGAGGKVEVRGVETTVGTVDSQLALASAESGEIAAHGTLHFGGVDPVDVMARIALPEHPFDPAEWSVLGRETLREATIEAKRVAFDPALMQRFGIASPWRGWAALKVHVGAAARTSDFTVTIHELRDGPLTKPVEIALTGSTDARGIVADAKISTDKLGFTLAAKSPLTVEAMLAGRAVTAPFEAKLSVPKSAARDIALLIGRNDVLGGTVTGSVDLGGTIEDPTARAVLAIENLAVAAGITRKPPTLEKLEVDARWLGAKTGFELELTGHESGGRLLKISGRGKPDSLDTIVASIEAANFDITPFLAFAPPDHPAVGMRGLVSGVLKLRGLDPDTGDIRGRLVITEARAPIAAELATFRAGTFEINVQGKEIVTTVEGKIGRGTVKGKAVARLTGSMPSAVELTLALSQVSMISEIQPVIDANVSGWFARTRSKWTGKLVIADGNVYVPPEGGSELLSPGTPGDIVFIDAQPIILKPKRRPPSKPWLLAEIDLQPTKILVDDTDFTFDGIASGTLKLEVGDGIGLDGTISTERGRVDVLGRHYRLDHGIIDFDGSLDPRLDIRMMHDFRSMTLTVDIGGRSSEPDLRLSSDTGAYSQSQLLAFLAGATPSDDPASQSGDAIASGSLTILSSRIGKRINEKLPLLKFDAINYEAKTASSSRAIRLGKRLNDRTYLNYRHRFEPRPDENRSEATIEYELRKNLVIEGAGGERAVGADLLWRKRW